MREERVTDILRENRYRNLFRDPEYRLFRENLEEEIFGEGYGLPKEKRHLILDSILYGMSYELNKIDRNKAAAKFSSMSSNGLSELWHLLGEIQSLSESGREKLEVVPTSQSVSTTPWGEKIIRCYSVLFAREIPGGKEVQLIGCVRVDPAYPEEFSAIELFYPEKRKADPGEVEDLVGCPYRGCECLIKSAATQYFSPGEKVEIYKYVENELKKELGDNVYEKLREKVLKWVEKTEPWLINHDNFRPEVW